MKQLKANTCQGTPGEINFRYKLPKYVTKSSLTKTTNYLKATYELYGKETDSNSIDYLTNLLCDILPFLHIDICKHFACLTDLESNDSNEHDDSRHIVTISDEGISQCPLCRRAPATDNDGIGFCEQCLSLPDMIRSIQSRLDRLESNGTPNPDNGPNTPDTPEHNPVNFIRHNEEQLECEGDHRHTSPPSLSVAECMHSSDNVPKNVASLHTQLNEYRRKHKQLFTISGSSAEPDAVDSSSVNVQTSETDIHNSLVDSFTLHNGLVTPTDVNINTTNNTSQACQTETSELTSSDTSKQPDSDPGEFIKADILLVGDSMVKYIDPKKNYQEGKLWCAGLFQVQKLMMHMI